MYDILKTNVLDRFGERDPNLISGEGFGWPWSDSVVNHVTCTCVVFQCFFFQIC